jgi:hypothetical protein
MRGGSWVRACHRKNVAVRLAEKRQLIGQTAFQVSNKTIQGTSLSMHTHQNGENVTVLLQKCVFTHFRYHI